jgi:hypothetical protein
MVRQAAGLLERAVGMATDAADVIVPATYSLDEAARRLGISCRHAYALLERGEFPVWVLHLGGRRIGSAGERRHHPAQSRVGPALVLGSWYQGTTYPNKCSRRGVGCGLPRSN